MAGADHLLCVEDLAAAVAPASEDGLPWREGGCWPLDEEQRRILAYETFLLHLHPHRQLAASDAPVGMASAGGSTSHGELGGATSQPVSLTAADGYGASPHVTERPAGSPSLPAHALAGPEGGGDDRLALELPADLGIDEASCEALADELSRSLSSSLYRRPDQDHLASLLAQAGAPGAGGDPARVPGKGYDPAGTHGRGCAGGGAAAGGATGGGGAAGGAGCAGAGGGGSEIQRWLTDTVAEWREAALAASHTGQPFSSRAPDVSLSTDGQAHAPPTGISHASRGASRTSGGGSGGGGSGSGGFALSSGCAGGGLAMRGESRGATVDLHEREGVRAVRTRLNISPEYGARLGRLLCLPPPPAGWWRDGDAGLESDWEWPESEGERVTSLGAGRGAGGVSRLAAEGDSISPSWIQIIRGDSPPHLRAPPTAAPPPRAPTGPSTDDGRSRTVDAEPTVPSAAHPDRAAASLLPASLPPASVLPASLPAASVAAASLRAAPARAASAPPASIPGPDASSSGHSSASGQDASFGDASSRSMFGDVQRFVPYRLLLLLLLTPDHFVSGAEYAAFAERQLAAFCAGLLAAVWAAPEETEWVVAVGQGGDDGGGGVVEVGGGGGGSGCCDGGGGAVRGGGSGVVLQQHLVSRGALESLLLRIGRDQALPALRALGIHGAGGGGNAPGARRQLTGGNDEPGPIWEGGGGENAAGAGAGGGDAEAAFAVALRRLNTMAWTIYSRCGAVPNWVGHCTRLSRLAVARARRE